MDHKHISVNDVSQTMPNNVINTIFLFNELRCSITNLHFHVDIDFSVLQQAMIKLILIKINFKV